VCAIEGPGLSAGFTTARAADRAFTFACACLMQLNAWYDCRVSSVGTRIHGQVQTPTCNIATFVKEGEICCEHRPCRAAYVYTG
jgi:hypothetical protein